MNPLRILVVDDEPPIRRLLRTALGAQGYRVEESEDGEAALDRLEAKYRALSRPTQA